MIDELRRQFSASDLEWVVLSIALMGFLNKYNDAMGTPLEAGMYGQVEPIIGSTGWTLGKHPDDTVDGGGGRGMLRSDGLGTKLAILPLLPQVIMRDIGWTRGTPASWPAVGSYLRDRAGYDFPMLAKLRHGRAIRAIAAAIGDNTRAAESRLGLSIKHRAGLTYATLVEDEALSRAAQTMAAKAGDGDSVKRQASSVESLQPMQELHHRQPSEQLDRLRRRQVGLCACDQVGCDLRRARRRGFSQGKRRFRPPI